MVARLPLRLLRPAWSLLGTVGLCAALAGCGGDPAPGYMQAFGYNCANHDGRTAKFFCKKQDQAVAEPSRYCYKTLGDANCFDRPDPDSKNQALGSSGY
jgi:hypothetical protein